MTMRFLRKNSFIVVHVILNSFVSVFLFYFAYNTCGGAVSDEVSSFKPPKLVTTSASSPSAKPKKKPLVEHQPYNGTLVKAFQVYPRELPCFNETNVVRNSQGMFYTKLSKCSSSTLAGIAVQIARNEAARRRRTAADPDMIPKQCLVQADHGQYYPLMSRDKANSILWTFIREPASRQVSDFFHFHVSRRKVNPTDTKVFQQESLKALKISKYMTGSYFSRSPARSNMTSEEKVDFIMNSYDFIGVVERYHESLVVLKMLFHLDLRDILYTSAKRSGNYDDGEFWGQCFYIYPSFLSPVMKQWFQNSTAWHEYAKDDILLYRVVLASLDRTIDSLGRDEVEQQVKQLEQALLYADKVCAHTAVYPCSADGKKQNPTTCIAHDWACAYKCIETLDLSRFE
jgi:hypothetical protein